jgi:hypothetical protein
LRRDSWKILEESEKGGALSAGGPDDFERQQMKEQLK